MQSTNIIIGDQKEIFLWNLLQKALLGRLAMEQKVPKFSVTILFQGNLTWDQNSSDITRTACHKYLHTKEG